MPVRSDAADEKLNSTSRLNFFFKCNAFADQVFSVSVQNVRVLRVNVNVLELCRYELIELNCVALKNLEENVPHEVVIAFWMSTWQAFWEKLRTNSAKGQSVRELTASYQRIRPC